MANEAVLDYFRSKNRPFNVADVVIGLKKAFNKGQIQSAVDSLTQTGQLISKTYNKQTIYAINQDSLETPNAAELTSLEQEISKTNGDVKTEQLAVKDLQNKVKTLGAEPTDKEAVQRLEQLEKQLNEKKQRLSAIENKSVTVDPKRKAQLLKKLDSYGVAWRKRKRAAQELIDNILEGYPKKKIDLLDEIGIETDEAVSQLPPKP